MPRKPCAIGARTLVYLPVPFPCSLTSESSGARLRQPNRSYFIQHHRFPPTFNERRPARLLQRQLGGMLTVFADPYPTSSPGVSTVPNITSATIVAMVSPRVRTDSG